MDWLEHLSEKMTGPYRALPVRLGPDGDWIGGTILRELPSPIGLILFGTYRDAMLWLRLPAHRRSGAFGADMAAQRRADLTRCDVPTELRPHLESLVGMCTATIDSAGICAASLGIADWANAVGAHHTELEYTQAGALADPGNAAYSLATATLARSVGQYPRAESWFRRSVKVARTCNDRNSYVLAYLGLGTLFSRAGNGPAAKATTERALRTAKRWRLGEEIGHAHHNLVAVYADLGDLRHAYEHAREAAHYYEAQWRRVRLAADVATLWARIGAFRRAMLVFEAILPHAPTESIRAVWLAWLTRSAAACGLTSKYGEFRSQVLTTVAASADSWRNAEAAVIVAWADLASAQWDDAIAAANLALRDAERVGATEVLLAAEQAIDDANGRRHDLAPAPVEPAGAARIADTLVDSLQEVG